MRSLQLLQEYEFYGEADVCKTRQYDIAQQSSSAFQRLLRTPIPVPEKYQDYNLYISRIGVVWQRMNDVAVPSVHWKINTKKFTIDDRAYIEYEHASGEIERIYIDELVLLTFGDESQRKLYHKLKHPHVVHLSKNPSDLSIKHLTWHNETILPKTNMVKLIAKTKGVISLFLD